jgi:hypothetical protein
VQFVSNLILLTVRTCIFEYVLLPNCVTFDKSVSCLYYISSLSARGLISLTGHCISVSRKCCRGCLW